MLIDQFRDYCLHKPGTTESLPFGEDTLVFKVRGKIFALADLDTFASVNLKCDPEKAVELREAYDAIQAGYHMNKKHWNTIIMDGSIPDPLLRSFIDHSYALVVDGLAKKDRDALQLEGE